MVIYQTPILSVGLNWSKSSLWWWVGGGGGGGV
jgi:hypothetical protein